MPDDKTPETIAAANGIAADNAFGSVAPPIYLSSTFAFEAFGRPGACDYSRTANPSREMLADTLAKLEGGAGAIIVSSGMAAIDLVLSQISSDDLVIAPHDCYAGTSRLLDARHAKDQFDLQYIDQADEKALARAIDCAPALVLIETPSNPLMRIVDIAAVAARARAAGAKVAVDNTFLSPALQRPLSLGADFAIHSTTKYLNGHSDVVGGAVVAADGADAETLRNWANITGVTGAPFDAYLTLRGLRTLFPRVQQQQRTAGNLAEFLRCEAMVTAVHYPGLPDHPGHHIAKKQQTGFGAMLSFEISGDRSNVEKFVNALRIFILAESLGGIESLIAHPVTMTHAGMSLEARRMAGVTENLLRISVGLESEVDLLNDLARAFAAMRG